MRNRLMTIALLLPDHQQPLLRRSLRVQRAQSERHHCGDSHDPSNHRCATAFFTGGVMDSTGILASNTKLKKPIIISSQLWSPQVTSLVGSGLNRLFGELSKCAVQRIFVPLGNTSGFASVYQSCQAKL